MRYNRHNSNYTKRAQRFNPTRQTQPESELARTGKIIGQFLLLMILVFILSSTDVQQLDNLAFVMFLGGACGTILRLGTTSPTPPASTPVEPFYQVDDYKIYPHTLVAIHRATRMVDRRLPIPIDIGLVVYRTNTERAIYRVREIPTTAVYIQPYVQLYMPPTMPTVNLSFEIKAGEQIVFSHRQMYDGHDLSLIMPPTRLAISPDLNLSQEWELSISAGDLVLASHPIVWRIGAETELVGVLSSDGEISEELQDILDEEPLEPLSLDDLLASSDKSHQQGN